MNILDIVIIVIFIFFVVKGYIQGAFKKIFDILGFIISIILFKIIYINFNKVFLESKLYENFKNFILNSLKLSDIYNNLNNLQDMNLPNFLEKYLIEFIGKDLLATLDINLLTEYLADFICKVIISLFIFLIIIIIYMLIFKNVSAFTRKLPILRTVDKTIGTLLGALSGILTIWCLGIIIFIIQLFPQAIWLKEQIGNSKIATIIFENNYLIDFLLSLITSIIN